MIAKVDTMQTHYKPLSQIKIVTDKIGTVVALDGEGKEYVRASALQDMTITIAGALGTHRFQHIDDAGTVEEFKIKVDCETEIIDDKGQFGSLLSMLKYTMMRFGEHHNVFVNEKVYHFFVSWVRDHVHTMKGMKYFDPELKTAMELFRDTQREDGMVWDNFHFHEEKKWCYWEARFAYGEFMRLSPDKTIEYKRIPVENDVEYLYIEGIYYTWKACGDDGWMASFLDSAIKAFDYSVNTAYRWSEKFGLLKRGYTIDTWDFQSSFDVERSGDPMTIDFDRTEFNIMHGDNTGFSVGCRYLAEMLQFVGRQEEAEKFFQLSKDVKQRIDQVAWNGKFYTHQVPENPSVIRDFGVDTSKQFSLSNAYALNRGLTHEQCCAVIEEYLHLKNNLPVGSPGEWYTIYPPFETGYGKHNAKWEYMNGGIITIVGGELCHGAFENGYEAYGVDILQRMHGLAKAYDGFLNVCFRGSNEPAPQRNFTPIDLSHVANIDFYGAGAPGVPGWTGEGENDLHTMPFGAQVFEEVPFVIANPETNGRKAAIGLSDKEGYVLVKTIPIGRSAASVYFLHTAAGSQYTGEILFQYEDGTHYRKYVTQGQDILQWWTPELHSKSHHLRIAWEGTNSMCGRIGVSLCGVDNPFPDKRILAIVLKGTENGNFWSVMGITLSDAPVYFKPDEVSYGIPENWGAAAVVYGLVEGLCGVVDQSTAFEQIKLAPRWPASDVKTTSVFVKYPASNGYVAYDYQISEDQDLISMRVTGNEKEVQFHCLLPQGFAADPTALQVKLGGKDVDFEIVKIRDQEYVDFIAKDLPLIEVEIIK